MQTKLITALDVPSYEDAMDFIDTLDNSVEWFKVGLELFISDGGVMMQALKSQKLKIMLDLKLHDIPETVARATKAAIDLGADMLTLHAFGGRKMMEAAAKAANGKVKLLAVTALTSMDLDDFRELGVPCSPGEAEPSLAWQVTNLAELAGQCGIDGLVCSALEAAALRAAHPGFTLVTPGIRPTGGEAGDQKRVATPKMAREAGASFIVVGRPIRDVSPKVRVDVVKGILAELEAPLAS
jgi:orotidine-5'-phosphate decarboxylase